jgi:hypothetical protein
MLIVSISSTLAAPMPMTAQPRSSRQYSSRAAAVRSF